MREDCKKEPQSWLCSQVWRPWCIYNLALPSRTALSIISDKDGLCKWVLLFSHQIPQGASFLSTDCHECPGDGEAHTIPTGMMWQRWLSVSQSSCCPFYSTYLSLVTSYSSGAKFYSPSCIWVWSCNYFLLMECEWKCWVSLPGHSN